MSSRLITMSGPVMVDVAELSNFEAGVLALAELNRAVPGITWGQLAAGVDRGAMNGWLTDIGKSVSRTVSKGGSAVMDVGRGAGDLVKNAFDATGSKMGDAVRLLTDEKVIDGATKGYTAYTDSGGVAGFWGGSSFFGDSGSSSGESGGAMQSAASGVWDFITNLGAGVKKQASTNQAASFGGGLPGGPFPWIVGGVFAFYLVARKR